MGGIRKSIETMVEVRHGGCGRSTITVCWVDGCKWWTMRPATDRMESVHRASIHLQSHHGAKTTDARSVTAMTTHVIAWMPNEG